MVYFHTNPSFWYIFLPSPNFGILASGRVEMRKICQSVFNQFPHLPKELKQIKTDLGETIALCL
jgi:hypothetical protein